MIVSISRQHLYTAITYYVLLFFSLLLEVLHWCTILTVQERLINQENVHIFRETCSFLMLAICVYVSDRVFLDSGSLCQTCVNLPTQYLHLRQMLVFLSFSVQLLSQSTLPVLIHKLCFASQLVSFCFVSLLCSLLPQSTSDSPNSVAAVKSSLPTCIYQHSRFDIHETDIRRHA